MRVEYLLTQIGIIVRGNNACACSRAMWRQPKETALSAFVDLVGNRPITSLTRADALRLRSHWQDRVVAGEVQIGTVRTCLEPSEVGIPTFYEAALASGDSEHWPIMMRMSAWGKKRHLGSGAVLK